MHKKLLFVSLFFLFKFLSAQEQAKSKLITSFSFTPLVSGIIYINAHLDGYSDTLNFILDTGCGGISLDSSVVEKFKLSVDSSSKVIRGVTSMRKAVFVKNQTLRLPGLNIDSLNFHVNNYELLSSVYGIKIDGLIGYSFFKRFIVSVNYDYNTIAVYSQGKFKYPNGGDFLSPSFSTLPRQNGLIEDEKMINNSFIFDSGAGLSLLLNEKFLKDSSLLKKGKKKYITHADAFGTSEPIEVTVIKSFSLGKYKFKNVPTCIFKDNYNVTYYPKTVGLVGNDILKRFNIIYNYQDSSIYIKPNSHFGALFDYSYNGLSMYLIGGDIVITDVVKGSPSETAGLKSGDIILSVDNDVSKNLQDYRVALQKTNAPVRLLIARNGKMVEILLFSKSILN